MASTVGFNNFTKPCRRCQSMEHVRQSACRNCGLVFFAKKLSKKFRMRELRARRREKPSKKPVSLRSPHQDQPGPSHLANNCHDVLRDADINGESSASEQQPDEDMDDSESVAQEKKCVDSEQVLVEEKHTDTKDKDQHSEEESSKPVISDNIATSAIHKRPSTTITLTRSPAKGSAEYHERIKKLEDLRLPPLLRSSYLTSAVSRSAWSVKGNPGQSSGNGDGSDGTTVRKGPKVKIVKRSQKPKRLTDRLAAASKKKEMEVVDDQKKGRGRPKGSGWLQQEKEEELEQVLEDRGEFFSLVLVGINGRLSQQNTFWNKLKKQSL